MESEITNVWIDHNTKLLSTILFVILQDENQQLKLNIANFDLWISITN